MITQGTVYGLTVAHSDDGISDAVHDTGTRSPTKTTLTRIIRRPTLYPRSA